MAIAPGQPAPDFELPDQSGEKVRLSDYRGKQSVAIVFYGFTFTGICEAELCELRDDYSQFTDADVQVLAISCDSKNSQKVWAEQQGFTFPVLADFWPHGEVAQAYGVFNEATGSPNRATFLINKEGTIVDAFETENLGVARQLDRYEEALAKL